MAKLDPELNRLLERAARAAEPAPEMPYGFETRVVAWARENLHADSARGQLTSFLRRVALAAVVVTALSSSAAYWQLSESDDLAEPLSNTYAIADTAIDANFFQ